MIKSKDIQVHKKYALKGHKDCIYSLAPAQENTNFFSAAGDGLVVRWEFDDLQSGRIIAKVPASIYAIHYEEERNNLVVGQNYEGIHIVDLDQNHEVGSVKITQSAIFDIKVYKEQILIASGDGKVTVVNYQNLNILRTIHLSRQSARCIAINWHAEEMAIGYSDHKIRVVDLKTYALKYEIDAHKNSVFTLCYSPDGHRLLSGSRDAHLKIWDVNQHYQLQKAIVAHMYCINHVVYRPDARYFATCSMDKSVKVWDAEHFKLLKVIDKARHAGHATSVNKLLWSDYANDELQNPLISASDDRSLSVWQVDINEKKNDYL